MEWIGTGWGGWGLSRAEWIGTGWGVSRGGVDRYGVGWLGAKQGGVDRYGVGVSRVEWIGTGLGEGGGGWWIITGKKFFDASRRVLKLVHWAFCVKLFTLYRGRKFAHGEG